MVFPLNTELENNQTLWSDYNKIVELCGKDSPQATDMLQVCIASTKRIEEEYNTNIGE